MREPVLNNGKGDPATSPGTGAGGDKGGTGNKEQPMYIPPRLEDGSHGSVNGNGVNLNGSRASGFADASNGTGGHNA